MVSFFDLFDLYLFCKRLMNFFGNMWWRNHSKERRGIEYQSPNKKKGNERKREKEDEGRKGGNREF